MTCLSSKFQWTSDTRTQISYKPRTFNVLSIRSQWILSAYTAWNLCFLWVIALNPLGITQEETHSIWKHCFYVSSVYRTSDLSVIAGCFLEHDRHPCCLQHEKCILLKDEFFWSVRFEEEMILVSMTTRYDSQKCMFWSYRLPGYLWYIKYQLACTLFRVSTKSNSRVQL